MAKYPDRHSAVIPALHAAQQLHGWCSPQAIHQVAAVMQVTPAYLTSRRDLLRHARDRARARAPPRRLRLHEHRVLAARSRRPFYDAMVAAAPSDPEVHVRAFECLGACDIAPMASVDGEYVGPLDREDAAQIVEDLEAGAAGACATSSSASARAPIRASPSCDVKLLLDRIDEPGLNTLAVYERRGGYQSLRKALAMSPEEVLGEITDSGLRGRGGAGFRMGRKASFLPHGNIDKYLVCNADESEPGAFKDRELMQKNPHSLIEGIVIASWAADIDRAFIYIRGEYEHAGRHPRGGDRRGGGTPATSESESSAPSTRSGSCSTAAPGRTSAARRPDCSTRSRASAATHG